MISFSWQSLIAIWTDDYAGVRVIPRFLGRHLLFPSSPADGDGRENPRLIPSPIKIITERAPRRTL
jgi:hypothetical protein